MIIHIPGFWPTSDPGGVTLNLSEMTPKKAKWTKRIRFATNRFGLKAVCFLFSSSHLYLHRQDMHVKLIHRKQI